MPTAYKYHLQPYAGRSTRHKCPKCGRGQSFSYYIDDNGWNPGPQYGRCNHTGCGYLLYPSHITAPAAVAAPSPNLATEKQPPIYYTRANVAAYRPAAMNNALCRYLCTRLTDMNRFFDVLRQYCIGSVEDGIIFWQIDEHFTIHRGKVMWYRPDGHRLKLTRPDGSEYGKVQMMWKYIPNHHRDRDPEMCYFGQHLATLYPNKPLALVESEKTALVMSYYYPNFIWVSTLSLANFQAYRLTSLKDRKTPIIIFPDFDGYDQWHTKALAIKDLMPDSLIFVDDFILSHGSEKDDLADIFLRDPAAVYDAFIQQASLYESINCPTA